MDQDEAWKADGLEAMQMQLVRTPESRQQLQPQEQQILDVFHPEFCYPLFGETQTIYGYKDLKIDSQFASGSLLTFLNVTYKAKLPARSSAQADDVEGLLYAKLPADYLKDKATFDKRVAEDEKNFQPLGTRIGAYGRKWVDQTQGTNGKTSTPKKLDKGKQKARIPDSDEEDEAEDFEPHWEQCDPSEEGAVVVEAWHASMKTPGFRELHRRMQFFVLLYIEGGSYIEEEDEKWDFVVLYEKRPSPNTPSQSTYHFIGYTSLYPFFHYPDKVRTRISQFVIPPPHQRSGHGAHLYNIVYFWLLMNDDVAELTVEDPSELFQDMRDKRDLENLLAQDAVIDLPFDKTVVEGTRKAMKLAPRQFARLLEMAIVMQIGGEEAKENKEFRLAVKERLYRHNYDIIKDLEPEERKEKLQQTFEGVLNDHVRILTGGEEESDDESDEDMPTRKLKSVVEEEEP